MIILTARDPQTNREEALRAGATAFFQKPVDNSRLLGPSAQLRNGVAGNNGAQLTYRADFISRPSVDRESSLLCHEPFP